MELKHDQEKTCGAFVPRKKIHRISGFLAVARTARTDDGSFFHCRTFGEDSVWNGRFGGRTADHCGAGSVCGRAVCL